MAITIVPYEPTHQRAVSKLNERLRAGNASVQLSGNPLSEWLPPDKHKLLFQERFLALDEHSDVRGAYVLKHQEFRVRGSTRTVCQYQGPLSEGIVDRRYNHVGLALLGNVMRQQAPLFTLGMGSIQNPFPQLLLARRWTIVPVPLFFRVVRAGGFLRNIVALRRSRFRRFGCDLLANSGFGWLGIRALNLWNRPRNRDSRVGCTEIASFGDWADRMWTESRDEYSFVAVRDSLALNTLYPKHDKRFIRLRVHRAGEDLGWAVLLLTRMENHNYFGNMTVGTLVDGFCHPSSAAAVIDCVRRDFEAHGPDLIVSNQAHLAWRNGLREAGFLEGPTNFLFAASPALTRDFEPLQTHLPTFHINRGDGDGPVNL